MNIKPIRTELEYKTALQSISAMFDNAPEVNTPQGDFFEVMCLLIEDYEKKHFPIEPPNPVEAIKFRMQQQGLTPKDLATAIGSKHRVLEILSYKRKVTLPMIRKLHKQFGIPLRSLVGV